MRKNYFFVILLLSLKILAQNQEPDPTFNAKETRVYRQDIGISGFCLPNNKILSVYQYGYEYNALLLNEDGSPDKNFNTTDSYSGKSFDIYAKPDGKFLTLDYSGKLTGFNVDGTLNPDFKIAQLSTTSSSPLLIKKIIYQEDGKVIIFGQFNQVNDVYTGGFARLNADGSLDSTFKPAYTSINAIALQNDGKYVVAIRSISGLARLLPNGKIDTTFKVYTSTDPKQGFVTNGFETENNSIISDVTVQPDGKIIAVGCNFKENGRVISYYIARLNSNGTRDTEFKSLISTTPRPEKVYLQKDNKIILNMNSSTFIRLNTDGTEDNTFKYSNTVSLINKGKLFLQGDKMIISSPFKDNQGITRKGIHRINSDGSHDVTFNPHAGLNLFFEEWEDYEEYPLVLKVLSDQKILLAGEYTTYNDVPVKRIIRIQQNGLLDPSFKLDPAVKVYEKLDSDYTLIQQKDGKIVILHENSLLVNEVKKSIIRLNSDGSLDTTFNCTIGGGSIAAMELTADGNFLLMGSTGAFRNTTDKYYSYNLIRLNSDGSVDPDFKVLFYHQPYLLHHLRDDNFFISFLDDNSYYPYKNVLKINKDGVTDTSFKADYMGYHKVKELSNGKLLVSVQNVLSRINADGSADSSFPPYNFGTSKVDQYDFYENGNINLLVSSNETNTTKRITLSSEGALLNTTTYGSAYSFAVHNCEDLIFYGYFTKIDNKNIHTIARFKLSNSDTSANPSGEIYQPFRNGQTLGDLKVSGTNIKWYTTQSDCGINNKLTSRTNAEQELPSSTVLENGKTYYASQTLNNFESTYRLPVTVYLATLGVKENQLPNLVTYPNPVKDYYNISNSENITKIEVYNVLGQLLFIDTYDKNNVKIDFTTSKSGLYFAKIYADDKSAIVKIIKI